MKLSMIIPALYFVEKWDFNSLLYIVSASTESDESLYRALILHKCYHSQVKFILFNFKDQCKDLFSDISLKGLKKTAKNIFRPNLSVN
jgi:methyl coenzyme M reductase alpha subunit